MYDAVNHSHLETLTVFGILTVGVWNTDYRMNLELS